MSRLRIGMVGCGYFARYHLTAWQAIADAELVAVCDIERSKAEAAAREFGAQAAYTDLSDMLDRHQFDLIDIATRMDTHRPLAALCAERGIGAIVQKPLAPDWREAVAIVETAARAETFLAVHENFRYQAAMLRVAYILRSGAIGTPSWARIAFRIGLDVYRNQPYFLNEERLVILDLGIHLLDLARVFLGEVERISCETQQRNPRVKAEDTATMLLQHRSGAVSVIECTYESRREPPALAETFLEIEGDHGAITLDRQLRLLLSSHGRLTEENLVPADFDLSDPAAGIARTSVRATCEAILQAFSAGRPAETSGADNLRTFALVEAAYESAATGRAVSPRQWSGL